MSGATDERLWPLAAGLVRPSLTDEISTGRRGGGNGMMEVSDNSSKNPVFLSYLIWYVDNIQFDMWIIPSLTKYQTFSVDEDVIKIHLTETIL